MKTRTPHRFLPRLEALEERLTPSATTRPISDFLLAQGTTSVFNFGATGMPDEVAWATATDTVLAGNGRWARVDYTGKDAAFLGLNLGTTTSGTVSQRPLADGRAEVTVNLTTHNAFVWATQLLPDFSNGSVLFGYTPTQLQANPNLRPPLADSHLQLVAIIPTPGSPLPDIVNDFILGNAPPGEQLISVSFRATATGTTPSGQAATLVVSETGVLGRTPNLIRDGGFTAEVVDVQVHGNSPAAALHSGGGSAKTLAVAPLSHAQPVSQHNALDAALVTLLADSLTSNLGAKK